MSERRSLAQAQPQAQADTDSDPVSRSAGVAARGARVSANAATRREAANESADSDIINLVSYLIYR